MQCAFFQWYDTEIISGTRRRTRDTNEIMRLLQRPQHSGECVEEVSQSVTQSSAQPVARLVDDGALFWKVLVFFLVGVLVGMYLCSLI